MNFVVAALCMVAASTIVDVERARYETLTSGASSCVTAQRHLANLLGRRAESASGVVVNGVNVSVRDLSVDAMDIPPGVRSEVEKAFRIDGQGPGALRVGVKNEADPTRPRAAYRRIGKGLYLRVAPLSPTSDAGLGFAADRPGDYVIKSDVSTSSDASEKSLLDFTPPSSDPAAKGAWKLFRVAPAVIAGPTPIILLHGSGTDRWQDFVAWATESPEAESFRSSFQLWDFYQPMQGVNAAIGFSAEYPGFSESIVAYLDRFMTTATETGVETDGVVYRFPVGPFGIVAHSQGGLKARAFLENFPERAAQVFAVVSLGAPLEGTPWATPEWLRHTVSRLGFSVPKRAELIVERAVCDLPLTGYISEHRQSDLDMGWGDFDAAGGGGLPYVSFAQWDYFRGPTTLTLSPRDANQTNARALPGYRDDTFEPRRRLSTYCGGLDLIQPGGRGGVLDKFFLYGGYIEPAENAQALWEQSRADQVPSTFGENAGLYALSMLMGLVLTQDADAPTGAYLANDGFVPLQSQLMLDGLQSERIYETEEVNGWTVPRRPLTVREDYIRAHTLGDPAKLRILRGWSHLDTVTGRYEPSTEHSELFVCVLSDLLGASAFLR